MAAREVKGSILGLINDDVEVISRDWLSELVSWVALDEIGAVGAKLMYANGGVQHGGIFRQSGVFSLLGSLRERLSTPLQFRANRTKAASIWRLRSCYHRFH